MTGLHANTQIPKVIGFERIAKLGKDTAYSSAARFFWQTVVHNRSISIGGNSVREHFNPSDNFDSMLESEQGPETCNSNNMLKLSKMLFIDEGAKIGLLPVMLHALWIRFPLMELLSRYEAESMQAWPPQQHLTAIPAQ